MPFYDVLSDLFTVTLFFQKESISGLLGLIREIVCFGEKEVL